jgi:hypothetical protein
MKKMIGSAAIALAVAGVPAATAIALLAGTGLAMAQVAVAPERQPDPLARKQPDPLARPAAPATTYALDGVRNGTSKEERDQHTRADESRGRAATPILPTPDPGK